jgi:hypothetical protein
MTSPSLWYNSHEQQSAPLACDSDSRYAFVSRAFFSFVIEAEEPPQRHKDTEIRKRTFIRCAHFRQRLKNGARCRGEIVRDRYLFSALNWLISANQYD